MLFSRQYCFFSGCRNAEKESSSKELSENISFSHEFDADSNSQENLFAISYQVPISWEHPNTDSGYYYPENGMLYVSTDASLFQLTDSNKQSDYEYSCAMKSHFRKFGNQMSGSGNHLCKYTSLLA